MVMTKSVNIEVWMKELRDRARLDSIESGPAKWNPEDQDIRAGPVCLRESDVHRSLKTIWDSTPRGLLPVVHHRFQGRVPTLHES